MKNKNKDVPVTEVTSTSLYYYLV